MIRPILAVLSGLPVNRPELSETRKFLRPQCSLSVLAICRKSRIAPGDIGVYEGQLGKEEADLKWNVRMFFVSMDPTLQRKASFMEACN
jgi:hypothetical protein